MLANDAQREFADKPKLKIALLGYRSNPHSGGQGIYLKYVSSALAALGHDVDVISGEPYPELDPGVNLIKLPGLNLYALEDPIKGFKAKHLLSATDFYEWFSVASGGFPEPYTFGRRLVDYLGKRVNRYDIIHDNQSLCYGLLKLLKSNVPLITTIHHPITWDRDIALAHEQRWGYRLLIKRWHSFLKMQIKVAQQIPHIVTVSESSKRDITQAFKIDPARIEVVYNGIDNHHFRPLPGIKRDSNRLISTASADQPLKGTRYLIEAFSLLHTKNSELRLTIIGKPKPGGITEQLITRHNLNNAIQFIHGISAQKITELYAQSTVAIVPSEYEGFGLPAGEAMACGVPVVSTNGGALPEVVGDAGIIVPIKDSQALADGIEKLLNDKQLREQLSSKGRARIIESFSWSRAATQLIQIYQRQIVS